ncbi:mucin-16-like [Sorex fumeus]|uniref:mucin-16-like n=1 Tax=Sorex fumeus TaxID=62283 RepID=UPI0024AE455D|nr:mucin-16-like [Sorex fumeus]
MSHVTTSEQAGGETQGSSQPAVTSVTDTETPEASAGPREREAMAGVSTTLPKRNSFSPAMVTLPLTSDLLKTSDIMATLEIISHTSLRNSEEIVTSPQISPDAETLTVLPSVHTGTLSEALRTVVTSSSSRTSVPGLVQSTVSPGTYRGPRTGLPSSTNVAEQPERLIMTHASSTDSAPPETLSLAMSTSPWTKTDQAGTQGPVPSEMVATVSEESTSKQQPHLRSPTPEQLSTSGVARESEVPHRSEIMAASTGETPRSEPESRVSDLAELQHSIPTSGVQSSSTPGLPTIPTPMSAASDTPKSKGSTEGFRTSQWSNRETNTNTVTPEPTALKGTEMLGTEVTIPRKTFIPNSVWSTLSTGLPSGSNTIMAEPTEMAVTAYRGSPDVPSEGTLSSDTLTRVPREQTGADVGQSITPSEMPTGTSRGPEGVSQMEPSSEADTSTARFSVASADRTSPSTVSTTLPERSASSLTTMTSPLTSHPLKTSDMVGTILAPGTSSPPSSTSSTVDTQVISKVTTDQGEIHLSQTTAVPKKEPSTESTPFLRSTEEISHDHKTTTNTDTSIVPSHLPTDTVTETLRTEATFSKHTTTAVLGPSTVSTEMFTGTDTTPSAHEIKDTTEASILTLMVPNGPTPQGYLSSIVLNTSPQAENDPDVTQSPALSERTSSRNIESDDKSSTETSSGADTSMAPFLLPSADRTSPILVSSTLPQNNSSSLETITSPLTSDLLKTSGMVGTSSAPGTSSPPSSTSSTVDTQVTSEVTTDQGEIQLSQTTAVPKEGSSGAAQETLSSVSPDQETSKVTSVIATHFSDRNTNVSTPMPGSLETADAEEESAISGKMSTEETSSTPDLQATSVSISPPGTIKLFQLTTGSTESTSPGKPASAERELPTSVSPKKEPSRHTPLLLTATKAHATIFPVTSESSGTAKLEVLSTPSLRSTEEIVTSRTTSRNTETISVISGIPTGTSSEALRTDVSYSSHTSISGATKSTMSPDVSTVLNTGHSHSTVMVEPAEMTISNHTASPHSTPQVTHKSNIPATVPSTETDSAGTHGFASLEMSTVLSTVSEGVSQMEPSSGADTSTAASSVPSADETSPIPISSTLPQSTASSPASVTATLASDLLKTLDMGNQEAITSQQTTLSSETTPIVLSYLPTGTPSETMETDVTSPSMTSITGMTQSTLDFATGSITEFSSFTFMVQPTETTVTTHTGSLPTITQKTLSSDTPTTVFFTKTDSERMQDVTPTEMSTLLSTESKGVSWTKPSSVADTSTAAISVPSADGTSPAPQFSTVSGTHPSSAAISVFPNTSVSFENINMAGTRPTSSDSTGLEAESTPSLSTQDTSTSQQTMLSTDKSPILSVPTGTPSETLGKDVTSTSMTSITGPVCTQETITSQQTTLSTGTAPVLSVPTGTPSETLGTDVTTPSMTSITGPSQSSPDFATGSSTRFSSSTGMSSTVSGTHPSSAASSVSPYSSVQFEMTSVADTSLGIGTTSHPSWRITTETLESSEATTGSEVTPASKITEGASVDTTSSLSESPSSPAAGYTSSMVTPSTQSHSAIPTSGPASSESKKLEAESTPSLNTQETVTSQQTTLSTGTTSVLSVPTGTPSQTLGTDVTTPSMTSITGPKTITSQQTTLSTGTAPVLSVPTGTPSETLGTDVTTPSMTSITASAVTQGFPPSDMTSVLSSVSKGVSWTEPPFPWTETSTVRLLETTINTHTISVSPDVPTGTFGTPIRDLAQSTMSPDMPTEFSTRLSPSSNMAKPPEMTITPSTVSTDTEAITYVTSVLATGSALPTSDSSTESESTAGPKGTMLPSMSASMETLATEATETTEATEAMEATEATASLSITPMRSISSAASSANPLSSTQSGPGGAPESTISAIWPSSTSSSSPTFTSVDSSSNSALPSISYFPTTPLTGGTSVGAETSSKEGPLDMASTLETWIPTVQTTGSSDPVTRKTESVDLGTETSTTQVPPYSTPLTRTDGTVERITWAPHATGPGGTSGKPETTGITETNTRVPTSTVFPPVPETTASSLPLWPELDTSSAPMLELPSVRMAAVSSLMLFTINFTITNLRYKDDMGNSGSLIFKATERSLQGLLGSLLKNSSIGPLYEGCQLTWLRPEKEGAVTGVDVVCSYQPGPSGFRLDREHLYWELNQQTQNATLLGPYTLDRSSLCVNALVTSTSSPGPSALLTTFPSSTDVDVSTALVPFTLNFTITNLRYTPNMSQPGSAKFLSLEKTLQDLLQPLFEKTSLGSAYSDCRLILLRTEEDDSATGVDAVCTYRPPAVGFRLDREVLYQEVSELTHSASQLGSYTLDRRSLYINGYNRWLWTPTASTGTPTLVPFTLNFTITSLNYTEGMGAPGSEIFNLTERILVRQLRVLLCNSSLGFHYSGCRVTWISSERSGRAIGVSSVCTYLAEPHSRRLDREQLYWELNRETQGVTQLGPFSLDSDSLYVNGYTHRIPLSTPSTTVAIPSCSNQCTTSDSVSTSADTSLPLTPAAPGPILMPFTINFTITNLRYEEEMNHPESRIFNITDLVLQPLLLAAFNNTSVGPHYYGCRLTLLRPENDGAATSVDLVCTYYQDPVGPELDREQLYWELKQQTQDASLLGPYSLNPNSLIVNASASVPTLAPAPASLPSTEAPVPPTSGLVLVPFTLNFTITNLPYEEEMNLSGSRIFSATDRVLQQLLQPLFQNSSLGPHYFGCRLAQLRPEYDGAATGMDMVCSYYSPGPTESRLDRERLYWELDQQTQGVSQLGLYTLDRNSLYVDGFTWQNPVTTPERLTSPTSTTMSSTVPVSTTPGPILVTFTLNFTITNLPYVEDMNRPDSIIFNNTERILQQLLLPLFRNTSLGPRYNGCRLTQSRPEKNGQATRVDLICTQLPDPSGAALDQERLYWEMSRQTGGFSQLGPYMLDRDSLYINGYNHPTFTTTTDRSLHPTLVPFALNFTITNLPYEEDMRHSYSRIFHNLDQILQQLLQPLFLNTSLGSRYYGCRLTLLRSQDGGVTTAVDMVCIYSPDPADRELDRKHLYEEFSRYTHGGSQLGPYTLKPDSLVVDGYSRQNPWTTPTKHNTEATIPPTVSSAFLTFSVSAPALVPFTLNFTITNLRYTDDLQSPRSDKFGRVEKLLQHLLRSVLENTSLGLLDDECRLTSLRPEKDATATRVDLVCSHRPEPPGLELDREQLYWEVSRLTGGLSQLGPYTLDPETVYVHGYTHRTSSPAPSTPGPPPVFFTLNFTITNLRYTVDMGPRGSLKFNTTETVLQFLLRPLFQNTSAGPLFSGCHLTLLRPEKHSTATGVDMVCTRHAGPADPALAPERLYQELSQLTGGASQLGPYTLDRGSLYISGYTQMAPATTPETAAAPILASFTLNFTITNKHYSKDMRFPGSEKFNSTDKIIQHRLNPLLAKTFLGPFYAGCRLESLRREYGGSATGVGLVCGYYTNPAGPRLDWTELYWELSLLTRGVNQLGPFALDRKSLRVNGYGFEDVVPSTSTGGPSQKSFMVNFTIDNLRYASDMGQPGSPKFNITDRVLQYLLNPLFFKSSLGARFGGCKVATLRPVENGAKTGVDLACTYAQAPRAPGLPAERLFHELSWQTEGITQLGPYSLDKDSLYINGYNELGPEEMPETPEPATTILPSSSSTLLPETTTAPGPHLQSLTLNFTITNLPYSTDMSYGSAKFNSTERILKGLLEPLIRRSVLGPFYSACHLTSLKPEEDRVATSVDVLCLYYSDPKSLGLARERLYWELYQLTRGVQHLGPYNLIQDSLLVDGYAPHRASQQSEFQLHFRIVNWKSSSGSPEFTALERDIQDKVTGVYVGSRLQDAFLSCLLTNVTLDPLRVTVAALFSSDVDPEEVAGVFLNRTLNASSHWLGATYQLADVHVTGPPTSSQHFQLNFTVTNLPYSHNLAQPGTAQHLRNKRGLEDALNRLFRNSSIKSYFSNCEVLAFRPVPNNRHTGVDSLCDFLPLARRLDRVAIYEEFLRLTQNGTQLQNFTLDGRSILVDGYSVPRPEALTGNPELPFWAIILIGLAGLLVLILFLLCCFLVTLCLRRKEEDYEVQRRQLYYLTHLDLRKLH